MSNLQKDMKIIFKDGKKVEAHWKGFVIESDQSVKNEGEGSAPEPFDFFLASIGTCAGIYVKNFCDTRNIPTDNIKIIQKIVRNKEKKMLGNVVLEIKLPPDFPEKYKKALINCAELCSVKKHISKDVVFDISTTTIDENN